MELFLNCLKAFAVGGAICLIGQVLIDRTKLTPARIMVGFVIAGAVLTAIGLYDPLVKFAGAGATVPISGFGYSVVMGTKKAIEEFGFIGALSGGIAATAAGIAAAIIMGLIAAFITKPDKRSMK